MHHTVNLFFCEAFALRKVLIAATLLFLPWMVQAKTVPWLDVENSRETVVSEPVFGGKATVYETGLQRKRTVVLVHGLGQEGARIWKDTIETLSNRFHVVAFDLPGFGASDKGNRLYTPRAYVDFIQFVSSKFVDRPFTLVGHSMGATLSMHFAAENPDKVERLVMVDAAGILHRSVYAGYLSHLGMGLIPKVYPRQNVVMSNIARTTLGKLESGSLAAQAVLESETARAKLLQSNPNSIAGLALALEDYSAVINKVQSPTLILWGQNDPIAPLRTGKLLAGMIDNSRLQVLPGAGHSPMVENAETFNRLLYKELTRSAEDFARLAKEEAYSLPSYSDESSEVAECDAVHSEVVFEGDFKRLEIDDCPNVIVRNSHVSELIVDGSNVIVENSHIRGLGMRIDSSFVEMTGGTVHGVVAIHSEDSTLDLAGVNVTGLETALYAEGENQVFFSVSSLSSRLNKGTQHIAYSLLDGDEL